MNSKKAKGSTPVVIGNTAREFTIKGKKVKAYFPKDRDEKTMALIKNMMLDSHIKNAAKH